MNTSTKTRERHQGFALVITLSLMILLTVLAVGLLSLSSVSLRSSSQGAVMATARANARLALMMALSDLQKSLGPDKAITATSGILAAAPGKPNITGVWSSWDFDPTQPANYTTEKQNRFQRWLVSSPDPAAVEAPDFGTSNWGGTTIELVGTGSLGASAPDTAKVRAGRVPILYNGKVQGAYAWHVADESVKARINLYRDPVPNPTLATTPPPLTLAQKRALLAGQRPDPAVMKGADGNLLNCLPTDLTTTDFTDAKTTVDKVLDLSQVELLGAAKGKIKQFRNDITPYSLGVLTDVRRGGLKQDLSSVFEMTTSATSAPVLPTEFTGKRLYESTHGITGASDPYWTLLSSYYNVFRGLLTPETNPTFSQRPPAATSPLSTTYVPTTYFPGPVITKVESLFSFLSGGSNTGHGRPEMIYEGYMFYTPLITLHNPYNISIQFDHLEVTIENLPIAFKFTVNHDPPTAALKPLNDLFLMPNWRLGKVFVLDIANWLSTDAIAPSGSIVMKPGQTLVCSPYITPGVGNQDWTNNALNNTTGKPGEPAKAKPGYFGPQSGFGIDFIDPPDVPKAGDPGMGVPGMKALTDTVSVDFAVQMPSVAGTISACRITSRITSQGRVASYGVQDYKCDSNAALQNIFSNKVYHRELGTVDVTNTVPQVFALFSASARTTRGGVYDNNLRVESNVNLQTLRQGRLAGKPFLFHNPTSPLLTMDLVNEKPGDYPFEFNLQPFVSNGEVEDYFSISFDNRSPCLTGNTTNFGIKSGSYLEVPSGPMQTIADFRRSNVCTTAYQPGFVQPVANSWVHPMMDTRKVNASGMLDHSVLANHALYDRFYFSTFATNGTVNPGQVFDNFMNGKAPLLSQSFQPYLPSGKTAATAKTELFASGTKPTSTAYQNAAQYQMVRGAFNVNSTSVQAWKAVLSSARKSQIATLWTNSAAIETAASTNTLLPAMSLVNGGLATAATTNITKIDDLKTNQWNGYRELTDAQIDTLAQKIVDQVRARGPFLSMSEFVNRQLGADGPLTECGALESALAAANTNTDPSDPLNGTVFKDAVPIAASDLAYPNLYNYQTPNASCGNPAAGAPGWISQGDLMRVLEPAATVRSDTFVIRVYGEALDPTGKVAARAYAEAVVQRVPEYVDPVDNPAVNVYNTASASQTNKTFGRRINVVSFRWLSSNEI